IIYIIVISIQVVIVIIMHEKICIIIVEVFILDSKSKQILFYLSLILSIFLLTKIILFASDKLIYNTLVFSILFLLNSYLCFSWYKDYKKSSK
ncbi:hypothetical protein V7024_23810, partial [Bacillus sp. JJ864]|uniref:hypothetical protein n=1 Tax=Bacillus sp. JJ864 TaxID=3122975 RepID=UPI002FFE05D5